MRVIAYCCGNITNLANEDKTCCSRILTTVLSEFGAILFVGVFIVGSYFLFNYVEIPFNLYQKSFSNFSKSDELIDYFSF